MDKAAVRSFALWARHELISIVEKRISELNIAENTSAAPFSGFTEKETALLQSLRRLTAERGMEKIAEETAYILFNRFISIRYMEVNNCLPICTNLFSVSDVKDNTSADVRKAEFFRLCSELERMLPEAFDEIPGWMALLFNEELFRKDGLAERLVTFIPEQDWRGQIQLIGWLYQYYNTEPKDSVFAGLKNNIKITAETLPAATQLFTPDWIVRYMVENSLGRLWLEGRPDSAIKSGFDYYINDIDQPDNVRKQLAELNARETERSPENIMFFDPCMGSGNILVCAFDVLMKIYIDCGWSEKAAASSIVRNNLFGLDIDRRAYQLTYFALMMKAMQYNSQILDENIYPELCWTFNVPDEEISSLDEPLRSFARQFGKAGLFGSLMDITLTEEAEKAVAAYDKGSALNKDCLRAMVKISRILNGRYDVVVTNPPYLGHAGMDGVLLGFVKKKYPLSKTDLFACFMEKCADLTRPGGYYAMITQQTWMFLSSYYGLRQKLLDHTTVNMAHLGAKAFDFIDGEVVQTTAFVNRAAAVPDYRCVYIRLVNGCGENEKEQLFLSGNNRYAASQRDLMKIPGCPVAYALPESIIKAFADQPKLSATSQTRLGMTTADNARFTRFWFEPEVQRCIFTAHSEDQVFEKGKKWVPYNKGGRYRKWYGNMDLVVNWENRGFEIRTITAPDGHIRSTVPNTEYYFRECATWSKVSTGNIGFRYRPAGSIFDVAGACVYSSRLLALMGFLNSNTAMLILRTLSPSLNYEGSHISSLPVIPPREQEDHITELVSENISLSREDWDSFETSWDFSKHPLI